MAIPKLEPQDWRIANAKELQVTDREVLQLLRETKKRVDVLLKELEGSTKNGVKRSQLMHTRALLLAEQSRLFERLGDKVSALRASSASRAARLTAAADDALLRAVGKGAQSQFLYESALQVSQRAIDAAMQRMKLSALPLAKRIYNTGVWMNGRLGRLINETLASGLDARAFAKRARDWFSPNTPGGVRYAAMRLARTEINNAFHAISAEKYANTPWTTSVDWNLSKSHPKPDICNELAGLSPFDKDKVPARPHPQCMCYITANYQDEDDFIDSFLKGEYDDYLDGELEKNGWNEPEPDPVVRKAQTIQSKPAATKPLPKTQQHALDVFQSGMTRDEWAAAGANINAIDQLSRKGFIERLGTKTAFAQEKPYEAITYKLAKGKFKPVEPLTFDERLEQAATKGEALKSAFFGFDRKLGSPNYHRMEPDQRQGVNQYTGSWYRSINIFLRTGHAPDPENLDTIRTYISGLDSAMKASKMEQEALVWRSVHNAQMIFGDRLKNDLTGLEWGEESFVSTSALRERTKLFLAGPTAKNRVQMRILVPAGTHAVEASGTSTEAELLIDRKTRFRVVRDNGIDENGIRQIDVEVF
jgi:hypothetical protein